MKKNYSPSSITWLFTVLVATFLSCTKIDNTVKPANLPRQFKTGDINIDKTQTSATLSWSHVFTTKASTYTVQISTDSTFAGAKVLDQVIDTNSVTVTDSLLQPRKIYFARVKANAIGASAESGWISSSRFSITGEQIFQALTVSDIIDNGVLLKWNPTPGLTTIVITPLSGGAAKTVNLTAADLSASQRIVRGLSASTNYSAEIFSGTRSRGYLVFKTTAPLTGNIIDLRDFTGRPTLLMDTLPVVPAGSIILLKRGETYNISSTTTIDKTISIKSGADLTAASTKATIYFTSNFNFGAGASIDSIEFNDLYMYSSDYGGKYVFNTTNDATVGKLKFLNSKIEILRGVARIQKGNTTVSNYIINNCIIDSIANYGLLTVDNATCKVENISVTNSTIYKAERVIVSSKNSSASVNISNCTFNEAPYSNGTYYIVDYGSKDVSNGISISNSIFGRGKTNGDSTSVKEIRMGGGTTLNSSFNYITADRIIAGNPITPVINYNGTSYDLWEDPDAGNFQIRDRSFAGRTSAGDPRWYLQ